jgi:NitT/TauT family transport system ATP-binding protein
VSSAANGAVLRVSGLAKRFGPERAPALADVSFEVAESELLAVVGPSGAGKTTLLRLLCGLSAPSEGDVFLDGRRVERPPREAAIVFQDYSRSLFPWLTVIANVMLPLHGVPRAERVARAEAALAELGLADAAHRHPWELSGGMQQRVAIARALVSRPELLLLDEPFASVDALTRAELQDVLLAAHADPAHRSVTIVHVTHDIDEALYLGDRVLVLGGSPGTVVGSIDVSLPRPRSQTATRSAPEFLELRNQLHALISSRRGVLS